MIIQKIVEYVEKNLTGKIDYDELSRECAASKYNMMRIFSALTDYTIAEYVRERRLSEAGKALCQTMERIIEIGFKFGYATHESFTKAFGAFNGFTPSECRKTKRYKNVPPISCIEEKTIFSEGEKEKVKNATTAQGEVKTVNGYETVTIEKKLLVGFGKRFLGKPERRKKADEKFVTTTRRKQEAMRAIRKEDDCDWWEILDDFDEVGFYCACAVEPRCGIFSEKTDGKFRLCNEKNKRNTIAGEVAAPHEEGSGKRVEVDEKWRELAEKTRCKEYDYSFEETELIKVVGRLKRFTANGKYAKFVSENKDFPMEILDSFTKNVYETFERESLVRDETRAELLKIHWTKRDEIKKRHLELFIPIK